MRHVVLPRPRREDLEKNLNKIDECCLFSTNSIYRMSEPQLSAIIALLCLGFVWDALKLIYSVSNEYEYRDVMTARLSRLEDFLAQRTCPRCECGCEEEEEEQEEQEQVEAVEEEEYEDEEEEEATTNDGAVYKFTINLNAETGERKVVEEEQKQEQDQEENQEQPEQKKDQ